MLKIIYKNINELKPYENNARTHSAEQIEQIKNSIVEFGFVNPLLIDVEGNIIAGHGRLEGAKLLHMRELPCIILDNLNDLQKKALIIADNKIALNAGWDFGLLKIELERLKEAEFEINLTGFSDIEIREIFKEVSYSGNKNDFNNIEEFKTGNKCPKCGYEYD